MTKSRLTLCVLLGAVCLAACKKNTDSGEKSIVAGKFTVLGTKTDNANFSEAKSNAENAVLKHPDIDAMVGLYGYNAPKCLEALRDANNRGTKVLGKVKIFGFDGDPSTLGGIKEGYIEGTVVQQPFEFGYQSMKVLKAYYDGNQVNAKDGIIDIPVKIITKDTAAAYEKEVNDRIEAAKATPGQEGSGPVFAFISNNQSSFWEEARAGCYKARAELGIGVDFQMPAQQEASEQNRIIESLLARGQCKGMAISVMSPDSQQDLLNQVAGKMPLVTHDSDAPKSARRVYLGTNNYEAGLALGKFMLERMPEGGKIMIFVGSIDAMNAAERQRGLLDALNGN